MTNSKPYYIFEVDFFLLFRPTQNAINSLCINHAKNKRNKITILNVFLSIFDIVKNSKPYPISQSIYTAIFPSFDFILLEIEYFLQACAYLLC